MDSGTPDSEFKIQRGGLLPQITLTAFFFAGFELRSMHGSGEGRKIVPSLFGFPSPFGHPGFGPQLPEGEGFAPNPDHGLRPTNTRYAQRLQTSFPTRISAVGCL